MRLLTDLPLPKNAEILDVGCGDGLFFPKLRQLGDVTGIETDTSLVRDDNPDADRIFHEPLGSRVYATRRFDLITALDVIEHIEDDRTAVSQIAQMLKPGGFMVVTVPAFMSLWDAHDEHNLHFRRYTLDELVKLLGPIGDIQTARYLFHTIFLPKFAVSLLNRRSPQKIDQAKIPNGAVNEIMTTLCDVENRILGKIRVPFGTSALVVLRGKPS